jgi:hypothetical protein
MYLENKKVKEKSLKLRMVLTQSQEHTDPLQLEGLVGSVKLFDFQPCSHAREVPVLT